MANQSEMEFDDNEIRPNSENQFSVLTDNIDLNLNKDKNKQTKSITIKTAKVKSNLPLPVDKKRLRESGNDHSQNSHEDSETSTKRMRDNETSIPSYATHVYMSSVDPSKPLTNQLDTIQGIIHAPELLYMEENSISEHLQLQGVLKVKRINKSINKDPTPLLILTIGGRKLPSKILCGYCSYTPELYIPRPLRCFQCQRFGHGQRNCTSEVACGKCSGKHDTKSCPTPQNISCLNCKGQHPAYANSCPVYKPHTLYKQNISSLSRSFADVTVSSAPANLLVSNQSHINQSPINNIGKQKPHTELNPQIIRKNSKTETNNFSSRPKSDLELNLLNVPPHNPFLHNPQLTKDQFWDFNKEIQTLITQNCPHIQFTKQLILFAKQQGLLNIDIANIDEMCSAISVDSNT
ncbi:unnamed protein product [Rotaria socialis]|uniref:CCHC-type domain-containing protein n=1 Tax=Rotaria socialis TaxID=392032 RepID=A0A818R043_9BILA|nr:unnamed protein product [Rotaria socialis]